MANILRKIDHWLCTILLRVAQVAMLALVVIVTYTVIARFVFNTGNSWAEEVPRVLVAIFAFLACAMGVRDHLHTSVGVLYNRLPEGGKAQKALDDLVLEKYAALTEDEIKYLLFERKWMPRLHDDINGEIDRILSDFASRAVLIAKRYEHTLGEIETRTAQSKDAVRQALERMGFKW